MMPKYDGSPTRAEKKAARRANRGNSTKSMSTSGLTRQAVLKMKPGAWVDMMNDPRCPYQVRNWAEQAYYADDVSGGPY